jgi:hypothetical protein
LTWLGAALAVIGNALILAPKFKPKAVAAAAE